jgi:hypothetical protein
VDFGLHVKGFVFTPAVFLLVDFPISRSPVWISGSAHVALRFRCSISASAVDFAANVGASRLWASVSLPVRPRPLSAQDRLTKNPRTIQQSRSGRRRPTTEANAGGIKSSCTQTKEQQCSPVPVCRSCFDFRLPLQVPRRTLSILCRPS